MTPILAIFLDAYRELNHKKLFWITLFLSVLVVAVFAAVGIDRTGISFLWFHFDSPLNSAVIPAQKFYKYVFASIGIPIWLTWIATILALVSTAGIFPDFLAGGAIELTLSKPVSRPTLFFAKFFSGLIFVGLQVAVFTVACVVVILVRGKSWEPALFLAVPIVLVFYSYLFAICTLLGILTRSTIAALLLTLLCWFGLFGLNTTDNIFVMMREQAAQAAERAQQSVDRVERAAAKEVERRRAADEPIFAEDTPPAERTDELVAVRPDLAKERADLDKATRKARTAAAWAQRIRIVKTVVPKTSETIALLDRYLLTAEEKAIIEAPGKARSQDHGFGDSDLQTRIDRAERERPVWWVVGTSLAFEAFILFVGCIIFTRRDF